MSVKDQSLSFDLACALRDFIESGRTDSARYQAGDEASDSLDERITSARERAAAVDGLHAALTKLTTPIADD